MTMKLRSLNEDDMVFRVSHYARGEFGYPESEDGDEVKPECYALVFAFWKVNPTVRQDCERYVELTKEEFMSSDILKSMKMECLDIANKNLAYFFGILEPLLEAE